MSWQAYVDTNLIGSGKVHKAAIHGHDGSCWATSSGFSVSETSALSLAFVNFPQQKLFRFFFTSSYFLLNSAVITHLIIRHLM